MDFTINDLDESVFFNVLVGMMRDWDEYIYFDKLTGDVLHHVQGYFVVMNKNIDGSQNRILKNRIETFDERDFVDEDRHVLIDKLMLPAFLSEWKFISQGEEPFSSLPDFFVEDFNQKEHIEGRLADTFHLNDFTVREFCKFFLNRHGHSLELKEKFPKIMDSCNISLGRKWVLRNIFKTQ